MSSSRQRWSGQRQLLQHTVHHRGLALGDWHSKKFELGWSARQQIPSVPCWAKHTLTTCLTNPFCSTTATLEQLRAGQVQKSYKALVHGHRTSGERTTRATVYRRYVN